ncbi:hypothetical protein [Cohnella hongkongensis]|uniref:Uncharacterized protein n=1 Tax=Cohnella hongkongensis TaxID=178337 RepID=A0ABV9F9G2_9BACL
MAQSRTAKSGKEQVEAYLARLEHPLKPDIEAVRRFVLEADDRLTSHVLRPNRKSLHWRKAVPMFIPIRKKAVTALLGLMAASWLAASCSGGNSGEDGIALREIASHPLESAASAGQIAEEAAWESPNGGVTPEEDSITELGVNNESAESPNGVYLAEAYGVNKTIAAGGLYPAEGVRLVRKASGEAIWSTAGYYSHSFRWSEDSRYVAVSYMARVWGGTLVVDARDGVEISLPGLEEIRGQWEGDATAHEVRADPYFQAEEWLDDRRLRVSFEWTGEDDEPYVGDYVYDVSAGKLLEIRPAA